MKDNRDNDLLIKTMLENGQEEVPGHIWDGISSRLDATASMVPSKAPVLWWKYLVAGLSVAAAIAIIAIFGFRQDEIQPDEDGLIAVIEDTTSTDVMIAKVDEKDVETLIESKISKDLKPVSDAYKTEVQKIKVYETEVQKVVGEKLHESNEAKKSESIVEPSKNQVSEEQIVAAKEVVLDFDSLFEEEPFQSVKPKKNKVSLSLSGQTGGHVNTSSGIPYNAPMRSAMYQMIAETGVTENTRRSLYGLPFSVGLGVKINLSNRWALGTGLNYALLTRKFDGTYNNSEESVTIASDIRNSQHYLGVPLNLYFSVIKTKNLDFYVNAGGALEKCVQNHYLVLKDTRYSYSTKVGGVQMSINLGLGIEYKVLDWFGLYLDPSLRYYFDNDQPRNSRTAQPLNMGVELGLRFHI